ncbi:MAG: kelch repeat-containing protein, partial [Anaerolineae bacterium]|nr:kelch repeat-containing protein [Anaerolineae bacterium]
MDRATITLVVEILFYLVLCAGVAAQLMKKYKWHDRLQAPIVILNIFFIIFVMIPTFRLVVVEQLPGGLSEVPTLVTALHGLLGTIAQLLSIYVLLAGFRILPRKIGVLRYWMWTTFVFWTLTILFGIGVYVLFYTGTDAATPEAAVAEHDADLGQDLAPAESGPETEEAVAEHDADVVAEGEPAEETVAEHDAELVEEPVAEHDAEPVEEVAEAPTDEPVAEHDAEEVTDELVTEHDGDQLAEEGAMLDDGTDTMDDLINEHAADIAVVEPEFTGQLGFVAWEQLNVTSPESPGVRYEHAMQYSEATNLVYIFGGRDGNQVYNDVWALDANTVSWRRLAVNSPTAPPARFSAVMMIDDAGQNLYIATGHTQGGQNFNDVWRLDLATETWEDLTAGAGQGPAERYGTAGGNVGNNLLVTHGFGSTRYDDTWQFDTNTAQWVNVTPAGALPLKRCLFAGTPEQGRLVIHGGCAAPFGDCFLDDTWVFDPAAGAWTEVLSEVKPVGRQYHTLTAISRPNRVFLYGGQDASRAARDDMWFLDIDVGTWVLVDTDGPKPPPRYNHGTVWVPALEGMVIFGGR